MYEEQTVAKGLGPTCFMEKLRISLIAAKVVANSLSVYQQIVAKVTTLCS